MTVSSTITRVTYTGNGVTIAFATTFPFFSAGEIEVIERVIATGAETLKTLTTHYTVSGGNGATGTVTAVGGAPSSSVQWLIRRVTARTQDIDYTPNDPFPAETHEQGLDRLKMNVQELAEENARALKFPKTDSASLTGSLPNSVERAGKYLAFDLSGTAVATAGTTDGTVHGAFMTILHGAVDAAAARGTLGALSDAANAVTNTKLAQMTANSVKANNTGSPANATDVGISTLGASLVLLQSQTAANSATIDFTTGIDGTYDEYVFEITGVIPATDNTAIWIRVSEDAGANWKSGATDYGWTRYATADGAAIGTAGAASDTKIEPSGVLGNAAGENYNATIKLRAPAGATYKGFGGQADLYSSTPSAVIANFTGFYKGSMNAITGVRFLMSSGNILSGRFKLFGLRKT